MCSALISSCAQDATRRPITPQPLDPTLASVFPTSGRAAGGGALLLSGSHFRAGATASIGGLPVLGTTLYDSSTIVGVAPALAPGTFYDVAVVNADSSSSLLPSGWFADFLDVDSLQAFHDFVTTAARHGVTAGCGGGNYCGASHITRAQMAVFLLKAKLGAAYAPPPASGGVFLDVPGGSFAAAWIEDLAARGVTGGCGAGNYCPGNPVTRAQMAVFLLKASFDSAYVPPTASGAVFDDVAQGSFAADWIEDLFTRGITGGCAANPLRFCPNNNNNRQQMAVFIVKAFGLQ